MKFLRLPKGKVEDLNCGWCPPHRHRHDPISARGTSPDLLSTKSHQILRLF